MSEKHRVNPRPEPLVLPDSSDQSCPPLKFNDQKNAHGLHTAQSRQQLRVTRPTSTREDNHALPPNLCGVNDNAAAVERGNDVAQTCSPLFAGRSFACSRHPPLVFDRNGGRWQRGDRAKRGRIHGTAPLRRAEPEPEADAYATDYRRPDDNKATAGRGQQQ
jgi:hypothetical protein